MGSYKCPQMGGVFQLAARLLVKTHVSATMCSCSAVGGGQLRHIKSQCAAMNINPMNP